MQVTTEKTTGNEITITSGDFSVTGYPSPAATIISAINGKKVPVPLFATGTLAVSTVPAKTLDHLKGKSTAEYGLIGGGRIALFEDLTDNEKSYLLTSEFSIVKF